MDSRSHPHSFRIDDHALWLLDGQLCCESFLSRTSRHWRRAIDPIRAEVTFCEPSTGRILASAPVRRLGAFDSRSFVWAWAEPGYDPAAPLFAGVDDLRTAAVSEGAIDFTRDSWFAADEALVSKLTAVASGWLGASMSIHEPAGASCAYFAMMEVPDGEIAGRPAPRLAAVVRDAMKTFGVAGRGAIESYLGKPIGAIGVGLTGGTYIYRADGGEVRVRYDADNHAIDVETNVLETPAARANEPAASLTDASGSSSPAPFWRRLFRPSNS